MAKKEKEKPNPKPKESTKDVLVKTLKQFGYEIRNREDYSTGKKQEVPDIEVPNPREAVAWVDSPYNTASLFGVVENGKLVKDGLIQVLREKFGDQVNFAYVPHFETIKHNGKTLDRQYGEITFRGLEPE